MLGFVEDMIKTFWRFFGSQCSYTMHYLLNSGFINVNSSSVFLFMTFISTARVFYFMMLVIDMSHSITGVVTS